MTTEPPPTGKTRAFALPPQLRTMSDDQLLELRDLVRKKAWVKAASISGPSDRHAAQITKLRREGRDKEARAVEKRLYLDAHWESLRWFLFGGHVDLPVPTDPTRAWDATSNPWLKIRVPGWATTLDEHDQANPYKPLPDKQYLRLLAYAWVMEPLLAIPKSRQMMVTWLFCAIAAHDLVARDAQRAAFISKKFDDANALLGRINTIISKLPGEYNDMLPPRTTHKIGHLEAPEHNCHVHAMGEEAKGLRSYTFSWVFFDESAFADQASEIMRAGMPTVKGGGRFTLVSTSNGEEPFFRVISDSGQIPVPAGV